MLKNITYLIPNFLKKKGIANIKTVSEICDIDMMMAGYFTGVDLIFHTLIPDEYIGKGAKKAPTKKISIISIPQVHIHKLLSLLIKDIDIENRFNGSVLSTRLPHCLQKFASRVFLVPHEVQNMMNHPLPIDVPRPHNKTYKLQLLVNIRCYHQKCLYFEYKTTLFYNL